MIEKHGRLMKWRTRKYVFLHVNGLIYWQLEEVINRTGAGALECDGYPTKRTLVKLRKRFWPTKADRLKYKNNES